MFNRTLMVGAAALLLAPAWSSAAVKPVVANVTQTLVAAGSTWGGCMARLSESPAEEGLDCPAGGNWVTFSCTGEYTSKTAAFQMFDSAQLAFVAGHPVKVFVDDQRRHNGYCFVSRLDVLSK